MIELNKLKIANHLLIESLSEIQDSVQHYLFWRVNINPMILEYLFNIAHDLKKFLSLDIQAQLSGAVMMMVTQHETLLLIFGALLLFIFCISSRHHYYSFLLHASTRIGKVTQDSLSLTMHAVLLSIVVALPVPILWATLGFGLQNALNYPIAEVIGKGLMATLPILWMCLTCIAFAYPKGVFIAHFSWPVKLVSVSMRYYKITVCLIIPLFIALILFENLKEGLFYNTLGQLCFILLCLLLTIFKYNLKRSGFILKGSGRNIVNSGLWGFLLSVPLFSGVAASLGYLAISHVLLLRFESVISSWFLLLVIYNIIRRWMFIQCRRIAFERAKQRRADIKAKRIRIEEEERLNIPNSLEGLIDIEDVEINLDAICTQSLQLVRSILMIIALISIILLSSDIHAALNFLDNLSLWDTSSVINGIETNYSITLSDAIIVSMVFIFTMQLVRNLPALLELAVLQNLRLTPGTAYTIITMTKYLLLIFGIILIMSLIGIEWSKIQWIITALSLGLGFGMQEIFSNFISGLILLFERPIRIGDTVTIRNLTGSVTKINTRTTTITDWDRKDIIVPNKAFITEQFINWSLSDTLTRVVLIVTALAETNSEEIIQILINAAKSCSLVLETPSPEAYLVDLQQGIQIFELRIYAAEIAHRMPLRHQIYQSILFGYRQHGITLPYSPFHIPSEMLSSLTYNSNISSVNVSHNFKRGYDKL